MIGILCEKPSAMKNFAKALAGGKQSGTYNGESFVLCHSVGHIFSFKEPHEMCHPSLEEKYHKWSLSLLPWDETELDWSRKCGLKDVNKNIVNTLKSCDEIVIATDIDPTGEGFYLAAEILIENNLLHKKLTRMYFTDESAKEIQKAFVNRKVVPDIYKNDEYLKAFYRARFDLLSMQWTRVAKEVTGCAKLLRQGRLKSAMVYLVGAQYDAIKNYKPVPYFQNRFKDENGVIYSEKEPKNYGTKNAVPQSFNDSAVTLDSKEVKTTAPPSLIDLAKLASRLAPKGYKSKMVMSVYQKMYEAQVVSYPRTEDKTITPEQFNELLPLVDKIATLVGVDAKLLTVRTPRKTHVKAGGAHGANRPGLNVPPKLSDLDKYDNGTGLAQEIYRVLAYSFLAMFAADYKYEQQKAHVADYPTYLGSVNIPLDLGWKLVYSDEDFEDDEVGKGVGKIAKPFIYEGVNPKPQKPTMAWLMSKLKKYGIGTGATRTTTYSDVTATPKSNSKYAQMLADKRGSIEITEFGEISYEIIKGTHIADLELTKMVESNMKAISKQEKDADKELMQVRRLVLDDIETMKKNGLNVASKFNIRQRETFSVMVDGVNKEVNRSYSGHRFTDDEVARLIKGEEISLTGLTSKSGTKYDAVGKLGWGEIEGQKYYGFIRKMSQQSSQQAENRVQGTFKGKQISFKRVWSGHKFTDEEIVRLLNGETIAFSALSQKTGSTYMASGKLSQQTLNGHKFWGFKPDFGNKSKKK